MASEDSPLKDDIPTTSKVAVPVPKKLFVPAGKSISGTLARHEQAKSVHAKNMTTQEPMKKLRKLPMEKDFVLVEFPEKTKKTVFLCWPSYNHM